MDDRWRAARPAAHPRGDEGLTLIEVVVAMFLLAIVMLPFVLGFTASENANNDARLQQAGVFVADTSLDEARAIPPDQLLVDRAAGTTPSTACSGEGEVFPQGDTTTLDQTLGSNDPVESAQAPCDPTIPFAPSTTTLDGYPFHVYWYTGTCYQAAGSCSSTASNSTTEAQLVDVVVDVTWAATVCPQDTCSYLTSTLFSAKAEPIFDVGPRG